MQFPLKCDLQRRNALEARFVRAVSVAVHASRLPVRLQPLYRIADIASYLDISAEFGAILLTGYLGAAGIGDHLRSDWPIIFTEMRGAGTHSLSVDRNPVGTPAA